MYSTLISDFTNAVQKSQIERLAQADAHQVVREVQEYFADFVAINHDLFSLNLDPSDYGLYLDSPKMYVMKSLFLIIKS